MPITQSEAGDKALRALELMFSASSLGDYIYDVREREGKGWDGPAVQAWSDGVMLAEEALKDVGRFPGTLLR